jgi:hypothetical protein
MEKIDLTDLADLVFWAGNHKYMGFQGLNSACTTGVDRQGFLWRNELYELDTHRSLEKKRLALANRKRRMWTDFVIAS